MSLLILGSDDAKRLKRIEKMQRKLEAQFTSMLAQLGRLDATQQQHGEQLTIILEELQMTKEKIEKLATDLPRIATEITGRLGALTTLVQQGASDKEIADAWRAAEPALTPVVQALDDLVPAQTTPPAGTTPQTATTPPTAIVRDNGMSGVAGNGAPASIGADGVIEPGTPVAV